MSISNSRAAFVNRSSSQIPIYSSLVSSSIHTGGITVGGSQIGRIYPNEFYTVIPNSSSYITSYEIVFRNSNGAEQHGYIETSPGSTLDDYTWAKSQEAYHYTNSNGSSLVSATRLTIDGKSYYVFTVSGSARNYRKKNGSLVGALLSGTLLATDQSTTGQTYPGYMIFKKKKLPNGAWTNLISGEDYGFVDLGLSVGSSPSNRPIR